MQEDLFSSTPFHGNVLIAAGSDVWTYWCPACTGDGTKVKCEYGDPIPDMLVSVSYKRMLAEHLRRNAPDVNRVAISRKSPSTSLDAARSIYPKSGTIQAKILKLIIDHDGLTDEELERMLQMKHQSVSAARNVLMNKGWIVASGKTRPNTSGNQAIVWIRPYNEGA